MTGLAGALVVRQDGVDIHVRLTPKADRDAVVGIGETADGKRHFKARVRAVPEKGKANKALEKLVAKWLGIPVRSVTLKTGSTARVKTLHVTGDGAVLATLVTAALEDIPRR